ncbi:MAG: efflux RND transporter periplasmic adaptor subunit [Acidobacteriota bacterium]
MKRIFWILVPLLVVGGAAVFYFGIDAKAQAPQLTLAAATRGAVVESVSATGTLQPVDTVQVGTQVSGTIAELNTDFNLPVKRGQVVAKLDQAVFQSQVAQAQATLTRLNAELESAQVQSDDAALKSKRAEQLGQRQLLAQQDIDTAASTAKVAAVGVKAALAQRDQAKAALDQAQVNLSHTVITSPVDGIVLSRNVEIGQTVSAGLQAPTLFVIARNLDELQLEARIDESDIGRVASQQPVSFTVDAYPRLTFTGVVRQVRLQPTVVQNVVSYTTVVDVPNPEKLLKPGMTATLAVEVARADDVVRVPSAAIRFAPKADVVAAVNGKDHTPAADAAPAAGDGRKRGATIWVMNNGVMTPVPVRTGVSDGVQVAVLSGVDEGAQVVTGVATTSAASTATTGSPLMPSFPRRGGNANGGGSRPAAGR